VPTASFFVRGLCAINLLFANVGLLGTVLGAYAYWQRSVVGVRRVDVPDYLNAILFGDLALLAGVLSAAGLVWAFRSFSWAPSRIAVFLLLVLGTLGGLLASMYSGSRGAWIVLPPALLVLFALQWRHFPARVQLGIIVGVIGAAVLSYSLPQTGVAARIEPARLAVMGLLEGEPTRVFWYRPTLYVAVGRDLVPARLWTGYGPRVLRSELLALSAGSASPQLKRVAASRNAWHAHNDVLQALFTRGLPGLALLLFAYLAPVVWTLRRLLKARPAVDSAERALLTALLLVPVCYAGFGLTYSLFAYWVPTIVYVVLVAVFGYASAFASRFASRFAPTG
jgi:O-antigen ligase